ncbi:MAG: hypothetical protein ACYDBJ_04625 [Aggregatilineales bacterium]
MSSAKGENPRPKPADRPRRVGGLTRYLGNRVFALGALFVIIFGGFAACALFAPTAFANTIRAAQSAGLKVYTIILGATGNPALQIVTYQGHITVDTTISRDMGLLSLLYGESANITGTITVALGADLKNGQFGILACDLDTNSIRTDEQRAPLAGTAFDPQAIKQAAYGAFEKQAAQQAIANYWGDAAKGLKAQFASWALGLTIPEQPTLTDCPANTAATAVSGPTATP